jgi:hypothetical protein
MLGLFDGSIDNINLILSGTLNDSKPSLNIEINSIDD